MPLQGVTQSATADSTVIVCVPGRLEVARLQDALPRSAIVRWARTSLELDRMLQSASEQLRMVVVSPRDDTGASTAPIVRDFNRRRPHVALVGYCRASHEHSRDIIELAGAGIHEIIFTDATDVGEPLGRTLASATQSCGAAQAAERLRPYVPQDLRPLIDYCLYFPHLSTSVTRVAKALGVHRKTLVNYTARFSFPSPSVLITWCRLVIVAHMLESRGGSVERIALALEYPSATALRNTLRRYSGFRPADLRRGGMVQVLDAFTRVLARAAADGPSLESLRAG